MVTLQKAAAEERNGDCFAKRPRVGAVRDFPIGCGPFSQSLSSEDCVAKTRRVSGVRDFPNGCGQCFIDVKVINTPRKTCPSTSLGVKDFQVERQERTVNVGTSKQTKGGNLAPFFKHVDKLTIACVGDKDYNNVKRTLATFKEALVEVDQEYNIKSNQRYAKAAEIMSKRNKWINTRKQIGVIPGINIGDKFRYRAELAVVGLHSLLQRGIDYMMENKETPLATSIVESGRYGNHTQSPDVLTYIGQGGNPKVTKGKATDQKPEQGNLALMNSKVARTPVRVIRSYKLGDESGYIYDGLYTVDNFLQERGEFGKLVFKFSLRRIPGQQKLTLVQ